jgi:hypothetical protein
VSTTQSWPSAAAARPMASMGLPPSDQSECRWQSPRISRINRSPPSTSGTRACSSRRSRYPGTWPASASRTTCAVLGPIPLTASSDPVAERSASSSPDMSATVAAAVLKARTR